MLMVVSYWHPVPLQMVPFSNLVLLPSTVTRLLLVVRGETHSGLTPEVPHADHVALNDECNGDLSPTGSRAI